MARRITSPNVEDYNAEEMGTVIIGPDWHSEVYMKVGLTEWATIGSASRWSSQDVVARRPYTVIWEG